MAALCGALLLTLMLAAPAAAAKPVFEFENESFAFEEPVIDTCVGPNDPEGCWDFDCGPGNPLYYGSYGTESLRWWYPKGGELGDPWIKGQYRRDGIDYFSTAEKMGGTVVSGPFGFTSHLYDPDFSGDLPKWTETVTGTFWGIKLPGYGPIFKEAGNIRQSAEVMVAEIGGELVYWVEYKGLREFRGASKFDVEKLCSALGY
ncbi:MAG: hypothetical protein R6W93_05345 [Candidatus Limnocylindrales bacterium]